MAILPDRSELNETPNNSDLIHIVDVSDTTDNAAGTSKKMTVANLLGSLSGYFNKSSDDSDDITEGSTNLFMSAAEQSKLSGIEASADVTDTPNVTAAGALMDSEVTNLAQVKAFDTTDYATAAQGALADSAQQPPSEGAFANGDKTKLDGIETGATADQSDAEIETAYNNQVGQVSAGEKTAGTETGIRRFAPKDIADMAGTHGGGGGGDATSIQGTNVDSTVGSPSDGDILVYRSAGTDFVLEAKPAAGSNPAIADITDWPAGVSATEVDYLDGVTSDIQTQIDAKAASSHTHVKADVTDLNAYEVGGTDVAVADGGTGASTASGARTNLGVDPAGTDNSTDVTLAGTPDYITISGQVITRNQIDLTSDVSGILPATNLPNAGTAVEGVVELATTAELNVGTDLNRVPSADALAGSYAGTKSVAVQVFDGATDTATGDGKAYFMIPESLGGMNLVGIKGGVVTAGTTGTTDIQIHNLTQTADMLSTTLTIDSAETTSETAATAAVIDTANDDVAEGDVLRIDVDAVSTTVAAGLFITLEFRLP